MLFISSLKISVVLADRIILLWIPVPLADAVAANSKGIRTLLASGLSTFPIKGNTGLSNSTRNVLKYPPDFMQINFW